ncbi:MAG: TRL-like protein family [Bacteroidota bacterium]|jgi:hypothetical protein
MKKLFIISALALGLGSCTISRTYQLTGEPLGNKVGVAKSKLIGDSDTSIKTAAKKGNITVIGAVEMTTKIFIFPITKTIVYGN